MNDNALIQVSLG